MRHGSASTGERRPDSGEALLPDAGRTLDSCSLIIGGPFHALMGRLRMLGGDRLPSPRVAVFVGVTAWTAGALLAVLEWAVTSSTASLGYLLDPSVIAHSLVAVPALLWSERRADQRLRELIVQPVRRSLVTGAGLFAYQRAVAAADRRSESRLAELLILVSALVICSLQMDHAVTAGAPGWMVRDGGGAAGLSWAGWWAQAAVGPLLVFMLLRWLFRYGVWTFLLFQLPARQLALVPTHPDRVGGVGYLGLYPSVFFGPIFAMGASVGAVVFAQSLADRIVLEDVWIVLGTWLLALLILFIGPLLAFTPMLLDMRERAVLELGTRAVDANRMLLDSWRSLPGGLPKRTPTTFDASEIAAAGALVDRAASTSWLIVGRSEIVGFLAAAALPIVPAVLVHVPFERLVKVFVQGLI